MFKENVRLNEALNYYVKEAEELKRTNVTLTEKNASLALLKVLPLTDSGILRDSFSVEYLIKA